MKIKIQLTGGKTVEVEGKPVAFDGFREFNFILHPSVNDPDGNKFVVAEVTTGCAVHKAKTKSMAIDGARKKLVDAGLIEVRKIITSGVARDPSGGHPIPVKKIN